MKIDTAQLRVAEGEQLSLDARPTKIAPLYESKEAYARTLETHASELQRLQGRVYAKARHAVLIVLQGMDTAGKDGAIAHVMRGVNPQGCRVASFKPPTPREARHDFLWRAQSELPERGGISIFNRSYYEAVLVERVHPKLLTAEGVDPPENLDAFFTARLRAIRDFEQHLTDSGTTIVKIFLHISKEEQKKRLLDRLDDPQKSWKASIADVEERAFWKDYRRVYEAALAATSVKRAPWFVVPADDKKNARLCVSQLIIEAMSALPIEAPKPDAARLQELKAIRERLEA